MGVFKLWISRPSALEPQSRLRRTQKCNYDIPKYCNMLTKNVASVVGQKCDPMFFWLWMAHPSMLAWIKNLIPSSSAWGHKKYGCEIVSLATSVCLFFWLWISHPSDLEPQKADFPSLGPSSQKNVSIAQCCDVWPNFYVANHPLSLPTCVTKSVSIFSSCSCVMQRRAEFLKLQCWCSPILKSSLEISERIRMHQEKAGFPSLGPRP